MARKKHGPLSYILSASLWPICLLFLYEETRIGNSEELKTIVFFWVFFFVLSLLFDIIGMASLIVEGVRWRLAIGISMILFQLGTYYWLWQTLGMEIGEISF